MYIIIMVETARTDIIDLLKRETPVRCDRRATHFSNLFNVACKRRQITTTGLSSRMTNALRRPAQAHGRGRSRRRGSPYRSSRSASSGWTPSVRRAGTMHASIRRLIGLRNGAARASIH